MAARATRSASRAASTTDDASRCLLLALSHDELGVIVAGLADPLRPVVAVALSSTCLGLQTPQRAALEVLAQRHKRAVALCRKIEMSCVRLSDAENLESPSRGTSRRRWDLTADDMATLGMLLRMNWLPRLQRLDLFANSLDAADIQRLCEGLGQGTAPSVRFLGLGGNESGPAGAEALAAALHRGALPGLEDLELFNNPLGNQGVAALVPAVRKLPALKRLHLEGCKIDDEGVASLVADLGKDDFKALETLYLCVNKITDAGVAKLVAALDAGGLPKLVDHRYLLLSNSASASAVKSVEDALARARARRAVA